MICLFIYLILCKHIVAAISLLCVCADINCDSDLTTAAGQMCLNFLLEKVPQKDWGFRLKVKKEIPLPQLSIKKKKVKNGIFAFKTEKYQSNEQTEQK